MRRLSTRRVELEPERSRSRRENPPAPLSGNKCPAGRGFGIDIDDLKECDKCSVWKECAKEADAIEKEAKRK